MTANSALRVNAKIVICSNTAWNLWNFRSNLIRSLVGDGFEVIALAPFDEYSDRLPQLGCRYEPMPMDKGGTNPFADARLYLRMRRFFRRERPAVYLGYTVKPNVFGSLAAKACGVAVINNVAGLGAVFIRRSFVTRIVEFLYRRALRGSARVFFQNPDDRRQFVDAGLVDAAATDVLPGSGVDLQLHRLVPYPAGRPFRFLLMGRMLWDKGVGEFVEAARRLREEFPEVEFCMLGAIDGENPAAIAASQVQSWHDSGVVRYLGVRDDVRPEIAAAHGIVLPSYREGTPRALLEAAAAGRPIITTDTEGCREVVDDGQNGLLCKVKDAADLTAKMRTMLTMESPERERMGLAGRRKMEREYDVGLVVAKYREAIHSLHGY